MLTQKKNENSKKPYNPDNALLFFTALRISCFLNWYFSPLSKIP